MKSTGVFLKELGISPFEEFLVHDKKTDNYLKGRTGARLIFHFDENAVIHQRTDRRSETLSQVVEVSELKTLLLFQPRYTVVPCRLLQTDSK